MSINTSEGVGGKSDADVELQLIERNGNNDGSFPVTNGERNSSGHTAEAQEPFLRSAHDNTTPQIGSVRKMKRELNHVVFWRVRLWMVIVFIFLLIIAVIWISAALCSVIHEDEDDKYDPSSFEIPLYFNGSFRLTNQIFTAELLTLSNQSRDLSTELQEKLDDLYRCSPALGRYFSRAEVHSFRNGSVIAWYRLEFLVPREHVQLEKFTMSREMVFNVLRQFLYDQEAEDQGLYIDPVSLTMV
ncbi:TPA-induced transmembrane protein homolog [Diretmus argenteus]